MWSYCSCFGIFSSIISMSLSFAHFFIEVAIFLNNWFNFVLGIFSSVQKWLIVMWLNSFFGLALYAFLFKKSFPGLISQRYSVLYLTNCMVLPSPFRSLIRHESPPYTCHYMYRYYMVLLFFFFLNLVLNFLLILVPIVLLFFNIVSQLYQYYVLNISIHP